jgi:hypothetical protein
MTSVASLTVPPIFPIFGHETAWRFDPSFKSPANQIFFPWFGRMDPVNGQRE